MKHNSIQKTLAAAVTLTGLAAASFAFAATTTVVSPSLNHSDTVRHVTSGKKTGAILPSKGFGGTVTAISGTTITISSRGKNATTYTVDASKAIFMGSKIKSISGIQVGDRLVALGTIDGTGITAKIIFDRPAGSGIPKAFIHATKTVHKSQ